MPKLKTFSIDGNYFAAHSGALKKFLDCNRQLKKVELLSGSPRIEIVLEGATHALIEKLALSRHSCLTQMTALKKLKIALDFWPIQIALFFRELATANILLEHLELSSIWCEFYERAAAGLSAMKTLKQICLENSAFNISSLLQMCGNLSELTNLHLKVCSFDSTVWNQGVLPNILQQAKKLQRIRLECINAPISADDYGKLFEIARERTATAPLQIFINKESMLEFKRNVPQSTINANRSILMISAYFEDNYLNSA